jgi:hypothetical protein
MVMKKDFYISVCVIGVLIIGCTLEPNITIDVPEGAIERTTAINVEWPDVREYFQELLTLDTQCEFNDLPENNEGFIAKCTSNCCLWIYEADACVERWCLNLENHCGWELTDWNCLESR